MWLVRPTASSQTTSSHIMSIAIAMAPSPAPHDRNSYVDIAPSAPLASSNSNTPNGTGEARAIAPAALAPSAALAQAQQQQPQRAGTRSPTDGSATGKKSPTKYVTVQPSQALSESGHGGHHEAAANILSSLRNGVPPKIFVKKEPGSPGPPTSRHRPRKLDFDSTS